MKTKKLAGLSLGVAVAALGIPQLAAAQCIAPITNLVETCTVNDPPYSYTLFRLYGNCYKHAYVNKTVSKAAVGSYDGMVPPYYFDYIYNTTVAGPASARILVTPALDEASIRLALMNYLNQTLEAVLVHVDGISESVSVDDCTTDDLP